MDHTSRIGSLKLLSLRKWNPDVFTDIEGKTRVLNLKYTSILVAFQLYELVVVIVVQLTITVKSIYLAIIILESSFELLGSPTQIFEYSVTPYFVTY